MTDPRASLDAAPRSVVTLAVLPDFSEEGWPSMDLVAEMLLREAGGASEGAVTAVREIPAYQQRLARVPVVGKLGAAHSADRLYNRFVTYPRFARSIRERFGCFHICDHSYSQLVHELPAARTGVFCHDLDTFRCLIEPQRDRRPRWFKAMARRTLRGLQRAGVVFYTTSIVHEQITRHGLVDPNRLVCAPYGVSPEYTTHACREHAAPGPPISDAQLPRAARGDFVLHVGSCIPRKRIEVLLEVFAAARRSTLKDARDVKLVQIGGTWTDAQCEQIDRLGIGAHVEQRSGQTRNVIAELYRRARVVLMTSESEGFGLPVIEALACGAPVVASDIPVLREVGGNAVTYQAVGDVAGFAQAVIEAVGQPHREASAIAFRAAQVSKFSWRRHARIITGAYLAIMSGEIVREGVNHK